MALPATTTPGVPYDYFHINAVSVDDDHNLLVSARNTWTVYKIDRRDGHVLWRLGGKKSDFALAPGVAFAWQHDPEPVSAHSFRLFDNEAAPAVLSHSRVVTLSYDLRNHTASLVQSIEHPDGLLAPSQGNSEALDNGDTFVNWGALGRFSEFDAAGDLLFDAAVPAGYDNYRAYRSPWQAEPDTKPTVTAQLNADGSVAVHAIWNGATEVARWIVVGGTHRRSLWPIASADWNGLDTALTVSDHARFVAVVAEDAKGRLVGRSEAIAVSR
ncbi:MAG TPA: arylsulfotransferase family protein [Polyangiaceae bacterium]